MIKWSWTKSHLHILILIFKMKYKNTTVYIYKQTPAPKSDYTQDQDWPLTKQEMFWTFPILRQLEEMIKMR